MNLLLDTEVLIWIQTNSPRISTTAREYLLDPNVVKWISEVSLFEIAIKQKIGKLNEFNTTLPDYIRQVQKDHFRLLPIRNQHITAYAQIPLFEEHRDPFDRLILATALHEQWPVMASDRKFSWYNNLIEVIW
ncbi:MAG: type II toxin-antitoxin system VapC family toxin [Cytophagales bacterium]|nr:MAG: type II toxin-antitoxin system VapC family toxin [Cytophagales bacterium]